MADAAGTACRECLLGSYLGTCGYLPHAILASAGALLLILAAICAVTCRRGRKAAVRRGKVEDSLPAHVSGKHASEVDVDGEAESGKQRDGQWPEDQGDGLVDWNPFDEIPDSSVTSIEEAKTPRNAKPDEVEESPDEEAAANPAPALSPGSKFQDLRGKEWTVLSNGITSNLVFYCGEDDEVSSTAPPIAR